MVYRSTQNTRRELSNLAQTQGGYFTAKQAVSVAYDRRHLDYHVKAGNFERVERGLFRLPEIQPSERDDLSRLSLWSRGRDDCPQAVVSHEMALGVHGLGELLSTRTHLSPPHCLTQVHNFRRTNSARIIAMTLCFDAENGPPSIGEPSS